MPYLHTIYMNEEYTSFFFQIVCIFYAMRGRLPMRTNSKKKGFLRAVFTVCVISLCALGLSACGKSASDVQGSEEDKSSETQSDWWITGWYLQGKSVPLLVTDPEYCTEYQEATPITLFAEEGVDLSQYTDGDIIEIKIDTIRETMPCQTTVYDVRFVEKGNVMDIDKDLIDMLNERGWIDLETTTTED